MRETLNKMKRRRFKKLETGYHNSAVRILAEWVGGIMELPFTVDGICVFVPDVTVFKDGIVQSIYEVVYSNPMSSKKYGLIQYWCYRNYVDLTVYEVSADFILKQTEKPERIETRECYTVSLMEYEEIQDDLLTPIN